MNIKIFHNCTKYGQVRYPQGEEIFNLFDINYLYLRLILCRIRYIMSTNIFN